MILIIAQMTGMNTVNASLVEEHYATHEQAYGFEDFETRIRTKISPTNFGTTSSLNSPLLIYPRLFGTYLAGKDAEISRKMHNISL